MQINLDKVVHKYNELEKIWSPEDKWHSKTTKTIGNFIDQYVNPLETAKGDILNAGSAGNAYGLAEDKMIHLDIADEKISHLPNGCKGSISNIPFGDNRFDLIVCVGSVINYNDPVKVFEEFDRVLRRNGHLVLEFENSNTLELIFTKRYNKKAVLVDSFYYGVERIWYYSDEFIKELFEIHQMKIVRTYKFHFLSPFIYRFVKDENKAGPFIRFDGFFRHIPILKNIASNTIMLIQKQ
ncbi:MAG: class I SAM-dependent methyltransferase [Bacteroidota bacterium]